MTACKCEGTGRIACEYCNATGVRIYGGTVIECVVCAGKGIVECPGPATRDPDDD